MLVQLWGEGQLLGQQKADANGHWQIQTPTLADGGYVLSAFAIDLAGNRSPASLAFALIIDTQAPTAPTLLPLSATSDTGSSQSDGVTANPTPTVAGQAAPNALVQLFDQQQVINQTIAAGTGAWAITTPTLTEGAHTLTATATDVAGNVSAASAPLSLVIDTQAPTSPTNMQLASATASTNATGALTQVSTPLFTGNATAGTFITLFSNGVAIGQTAVGTDGSWQVQAPTLADGAHVITAKAQDLAGNVSAATAPLTVTIDATAPVLVLDTNTAVVLTQQAHLSGYVDDLGSGVVSAQYAFDGLAPVALTLDADGDFDQAFDWTGISNGSHTLTLTTTDLAGNTFTQTTAVTVHQGLTAPTLTAALAHDTGWDDTDGVTANPQVTGTLIGGNTAAQLRVGLDGMAAASFTTVALASDGTFTLDPALLHTLAGGTLADGDHTLHLQARDSSGNLLSVADVALTLDTTAPTLTVTTPLTTTPLSAGALLAGTVNETGSGLVALQYQFDNLAPLSLSPDATGHFNEWLDFTGIADGSHTLTVSSTDQAGNVTASHLNVTVQNGGTGGTVSSNFLTVALATDTGTNTTDGVTADPTITGTISAQVAQLLVGFDAMPLAQFTAVTPASNGSLTLDAAALATIYGDALPDGTHTLRFQMLDAQGTVLGVTHVSFNLDTTAPDLSLPTLLDGIAWSPGEVLQGTLNDANPGATLVYNFDSGTPTTLSLDTAGGFDTVLQTLPTLPAAHTLNLLATDSAGNLQTIAYQFLITDDQPVVDTDTLGTTTPPADPKPPSGSDFVNKGQIGAAGGADGGWGFVGQGGVWGFGGGSGSGSGSGGGWSPSGFSGWSPSSPILPGGETPNPTDLNYIDGAGYHLDYVPALRTLLDYAEGALSNDAATVNKKAALKNRLEVLNDLAQLISSNPGAATLHDELAAVMHGIFGEVPLAGITKGEAVKDGYLLAQDLAKDTTAVTIQVDQAELLLTVDKVLQQQGVTTTAAQQTALATALKELATTYAKLNPTEADDAKTTTTPNFLDLLWRAQLPVNNQPRMGTEIAADLAQGATALSSLLAGVNQPVQAITFVDHLLKAATQVVGLQGDLHDAKFIRELVDFGFAYAQLNPTGTADVSGNDSRTLFLNTLWNGGNVQQAQGGLSDFFKNFKTADERLELAAYEYKMFSTLKLVQDLQGYRYDPSSLASLAILGGYYTETFSPVVSVEGGNFFADVWKAQTQQALDAAASAFQDIPDDSSSNSNNQDVIETILNRATLRIPPRYLETHPPAPSLVQKSGWLNPDSSKWPSLPPNTPKPVNFVKSKKALIIDPFAYDFGSRDEAKTIAADLKASGFTVTMETNKNGTDDTVNLANLETTLGSYGVIAFVSHGARYLGKEKILLDGQGNPSDGQDVVFTGVQPTKATLCAYQEEILNGSLVMGDVGGRVNFAITPSFVSRYMHNQGSNSLVYLGSCDSLYNDSLSQAFANVGAAAVVGYTAVVGNGFAYEHGAAMFNALSTGRITSQIPFLGDQ